MIVHAKLLSLLYQVYLKIDFMYPVWNRFNNNEVDVEDKQTNGGIKEGGGGNY